MQLVVSTSPGSDYELLDLGTIFLPFRCAAARTPLTVIGHGSGRRGPRARSPGPTRLQDRLFGEGSWRCWAPPAQWSSRKESVCEIKHGSPFPGARRDRLAGLCMALNPTLGLDAQTGLAAEAVSESPNPGLRQLALPGPRWPLTALNL